MQKIQDISGGAGCGVAVSSTDCTVQTKKLINAPDFHSSTP